MPKSYLPTYAIVELLIRLSAHNPVIGEYKNHSIHTTGVTVKTSNGSITFSEPLIQRQFEHPETISEPELAELSKTFIQR